MLIGKTVSQAPDQMCWSLRFKGIAHDRSSGYRARHCRDGNTSNDHGGSAWLKIGILLVGAAVRVETTWTARGIGASFREVRAGLAARGGRENAPLIWQRWKDDQGLYRLTAPNPPLFPALRPVPPGEQ